jgi:acyl carrier protein
MDGLMIERWRLGLPAQTINWGPWGGQEGRAARLNETQLSRLRRAGVQLLEVSSCLASLAATLVSRDVQTIVAEADWGRYQATTGGIHGPLVSDLAAVAANPGSQTLSRRDTSKARLKSSTPTELPGAFSEYVRSVIETVSEQACEALAPDAGLADLGFDSLMVLELKRSIESDLGVEVPVELLVGSSTLNSITEHLLLQYRVSAVARQKDVSEVGQAIMTL